MPLNHSPTRKRPPTRSNPIIENNENSEDENQSEIGEATNILQLPNFDEYQHYSNLLQKQESQTSTSTIVITSALETEMHYTTAGFTQPLNTVHSDKTLNSSQVLSTTFEKSTKNINKIIDPSTTETRFPSRPTDYQYQQLVQAAIVNTNLLTQLHDNLLDNKPTSQNHVHRNLFPKFLPDINKLISSVPQTDGTEPNEFLNFLVEIEKIINLQIIPPSRLMEGLITHVHGELRKWLASTSLQYRDNWNQCKNNMLNYFLSRQQISRLIRTHVFRVQTLDETLATYAEDLRLRAYALNYINRDEEILVHIWDSATSKYLNKICTLNVPTSFENLFQIARQIDEATLRLDEANLRETDAKLTTCKSTKNTTPKN